MVESELAFLSITDLARAYRARTLSPVEVTRSMLARIERLDPALKSFVTVTPELAMAQARQAEADFARGTVHSLMQGVPIGIKDLCETQGVRTTWGTTILGDYVPTQDSTVVSKLAQAGAVTLGKLKLTEGAYSMHHPQVHPPLNPWNAQHWTGVSSSGSGVATAAGLCYGAIGTDTGGSIRFPSGANGLTGLKPTWGRVSRYRVQPLADSLDHLGPMCRSAADAGAMFAAMAGADPNDPTTLDDPVPDCLGGIERGIAGLRIGFDAAYVEDICEADTLRVIEAARAVLTSLGARIEPVSVPTLTASMAANWGKYCAVETAVAHQPWYPARKAEYGPVLSGLIDLGYSVSGLELAKLMQDRLVFVGQLRALFRKIDVLLVPVHPFGNPTNERLEQLLSTPQGLEGALRYTGPFNLSGSPTITLPGGSDDHGMPIGFQLVGRHLEEALLVRTGHAFQCATPHHLKRPAAAA